MEQRFLDAQILKSAVVFRRDVLYVRPRWRVLASLLLVAGNVQHPAVHDREASSQGLRAMIHIQQYYYVYAVRTYFVYIHMCMCSICVLVVQMDGSRRGKVVSNPSHDKNARGAP